MGNKTGAKRYTDDGKAMLLAVVREVLPTGADEWSIVQRMYMEEHKAAVKKANEETMARTGTLGRAKPVERDAKSLKSLYGNILGKRGSTGLYKYLLTNFATRHL